MLLPLFKIYHDRSDIKAITDVIEKGLSWATGPNVGLFEEEFAKYVGSKHALMFNSGTSALHVLMIYYGFGKGDEVIVPSFTFIATVNAPLFVGATPVFAEIDRTLGLDYEDVERRITEKTKAIIAVHIGGLPCRIGRLKALAKRYNLILIEDACESLGAKVDDKFVGTIGDAGVFSFCANKIITTGEGGAIVCKDKKMYDELKLIRSHGRADTKNYFIQTEPPCYQRLGYNWRMSNLTAALGRSQLKKIDKLIKLRTKNANYILGGIGGMLLYNCVYQMLIIMSNQRDELRKYLNDNGIGAKVYFDPVHLAPFYRKMGYKEGDFPVTEAVSKKVLSLPIYPSMSREEMDFLSKKINEFE